MTAPGRVECPYVGLVPFTEADARFFYGREEDQAAVISNLFASRLTVLYGASGVGKTSLLRAGVMRELARRAQAAGKDAAAANEPGLRVVYFKEWQDRPLERLVREIRRVAGSADGPEAPGTTLAEALGAAARAFSGDLMVFLDQFEDYFKYPDPGARTFVTELAEAVYGSALSVSFLLSLRDDALSRLDRFKARIPNLLANTLRIEPLDREKAALAIVRPVEAYDALPEEERAHPGPHSVEPALVDDVLDEVRRGKVRIGDMGRGQARGAATSAVEAPYLQLVMTRVWNEEVKSGSTRLRVDTLRRLGGAERIVQSHLDGVMAQLSRRDAELSARLFEHLVTPTGNKIAHTATDLAGYAAASAREVEDLLARLSDSARRILTPVAAPAGQEGGSHYEIYHDALGPAVLDWCRRYEARVETRRRLARWGPLALAVAGLLVTWAALQSRLAAESAARAQEAVAHSRTQQTLAKEAEFAAQEAANERLRAARMAQALADATGNAQEAARFRKIAEDAAVKAKDLTATINERAAALDTLARENGRLKIELDRVKTELDRYQGPVQQSVPGPRTIGLGLRLRSLFVLQDGTGARTRWSFSVKADGRGVLTVPDAAYNDKDPQPVRLEQSTRMDVREGTSVTLVVEGRSEEKHTAAGQNALFVPRLSDLGPIPSQGPSPASTTVYVPLFVRDDPKQGTFVLAIDVDLMPPRSAK